MHPVKEKQRKTAAIVPAQPATTEITRETVVAQSPVHDTPAVAEPPATQFNCFTKQGQCIGVVVCQPDLTVFNGMEVTENETVIEVKSIIHGSDDLSTYQMILLKGKS